MKSKYLTGFAVAAGFCVFAAPTASASYMEKCNALIETWDNCKESGNACKAEQKAIEEQCKCHRQKGDDWKLVMAAVGKDGVCAPDWPEDTPPPYDIEDPVPPRGSSVMDGGSAPEGRDAPTKGDHSPEKRG